MTYSKHFSLLLISLLVLSNARWGLAQNTASDDYAKAALLAKQAADTSGQIKDVQQAINFILEDDGTQSKDGIARSGKGTLILRPKMVKATYLGAEAYSADATLRAQLKLPDGVGLAVNGVDETSPAHAAGLHEHDVLYKLNDQLLINPEQFMVLVRTFKPNDKIELTVIREAQPIKLTATLIEHEVPALADRRNVWNLYNGQLSNPTTEPGVTVFHSPRESTSRRLIPTNPQAP